MRIELPQTVKLTRDQIEFYAPYGIARACNVIFGGYHDPTNKNPDDRWDYDIEGVLCEASVAILLGIPAWVPNNAAFKGEPDVGPFDVRGTVKPWGSLFIQKSDPDDRVFVLVTGARGKYVVQAAVPAAEGKKVGEWRSDIRGPAYMVKQSRLAPYRCLDYDPRVEV